MVLKCDKMFMFFCATTNKSIICIFLAAIEEALRDSRAANN